MKEINKKKKEASVLLIAIVMILSTIAVSANTEDQSPKFASVGGDYISHSQTNTFDPDWIHFDDGTNVNALGLTNGGTFEWAARFTPDELADWAGYQISTVKYHHDWTSGPFYMDGTVKIYEEGTSTNPGALITSEPFEAYENDWLDIELSEPVQITGDEDIWVSVEGTHSIGQYPAGMDPGPAVAGKGDWACLGGDWQEIKDLGFNFNFNIWAEIVQASEPPETPERPDGPTEGVIGVEYTFTTSTTDPEGDQVSYLWDWGDETPTEWTEFYDSGATVEASHIWNESDDYSIRVKAKDIYGTKSNWSDPKTIHIVDIPVLEIGNITGGLFKVSTVIGNIGGVDATNVNWSITLDGGFILIGKETTDNILSIPAGDETKISSSLIVGFGKTVITVTAEIPESSDTKDQEAFVLLFFIL